MKKYKAVGKLRIQKACFCKSLKRRVDLTNLQKLRVFFIESKRLFC
jgi:hypothetical protein